MGVLVACSGSDNELTELRKELEQTNEELEKTKATLDELQDIPTPEAAPEPTPETLSIEEKEYYRQICEETLGEPPVSWDGCSIAIENVAEQLSSNSTLLPKEEILLNVTTWFECEAHNRSISTVFAQPDLRTLQAILSAPTEITIIARYMFEPIERPMFTWRDGLFSMCMAAENNE